ncbi:hypothetical protein ACU686_14760 [Yinghuangia aomiensis]
MFLAIDPSRSRPGGDFGARADVLVDDVVGSEPADGVDRVLVPGSARTRTAGPSARPRRALFRRPRRCARRSTATPPNLAVPGLG